MPLEPCSRVCPSHAIWFGDTAHEISPFQSSLLVSLGCSRPYWGALAVCSAAEVADDVAPGQEELPRIVELGCDTVGISWPMAAAPAGTISCSYRVYIHETL